MNDSNGGRASNAPGMLAAVGLYFLAQAWILTLGDAIFWDDWALVSISPSSLFEMFEQQRSPWIGVMHNLLLQSFAGVQGYRVLTFAAHLATGVLLHRILATIGTLDRNDRWIIVALFLVSPYFWSRVSLITFTYTLAVFLFFAGWCVFSSQMRAHPRKAVVLGSAVLFIGSFLLMPSLLVFFAVPGLHFAWQFRRDLPRLLEKTNWPFLLLMCAPFAVWLVKTTLLTPYGLYESHNTFRPELGFWRSAPREMLSKFLRLDISPGYLLAVLPFAWLATLMLDRRPDSAIGGSHRWRERGRAAARWIGWAAAGLLITYLAAFPYLIVGKIPTFVDWTSRHQVLLPLGTALLAWSPGLILDRMQRRIWYTGVITLFLAINVTTAVDVMRDVIKQEAIMHHLADNRRIERNEIFPVADNLDSFNAWKRVYRQYEWMGMFDRVFENDGVRYADGVRWSSQVEWLERFDAKSDTLAALGMLDASVDGRLDCVITIESGEYDISPVANVLRAWTYRLVDRRAYEDVVLTQALSLTCPDVVESTWDN